MMASKVTSSTGKNCFTVIIFNIPERLHHKGLWLVFDKHGEVVDSFIPNKRSKGGSRFGFVRFTRLEDARKAINCVDKSRIRGNEVRVFLARFQPREAFWRKKFSGLKPAEIKSKREDVGHLEAPIVGSVDEDKLLTCRGSLVGWCRNFLKMNELAAIMHKEGILGPKIMRLSGLAVLIIFEDDESRDFTLNNQMGALNKCFGKVEVWSENFHCSSRRAWLSCKGIPPFLWNPSTFRSIVDKWGELISIDEGSVNPGSFERALFQIITNRQTRVEESVVLKAGDLLFTVCISEFEPCFNPDSVWVDSFLMDEAVASPLSLVGELVGVSPVNSTVVEVCLERAGRNEDSSVEKISERCSVDEESLLCCMGERVSGCFSSGGEVVERNIGEDFIMGLRNYATGVGIIPSEFEDVVEHENVLDQGARESIFESSESCMSARDRERILDFFDSSNLDGRLKAKVMKNVINIIKRRAISSSKGVEAHQDGDAQQVGAVVDRMDGRDISGLAEKVSSPQLMA